MGKNNFKTVQTLEESSFYIKDENLADPYITLSDKEFMFATTEKGIGFKLYKTDPPKKLPKDISKENLEQVKRALSLGVLKITETAEVKKENIVEKFLNSITLSPKLVLIQEVYGAVEQLMENKIPVEEILQFLEDLDKKHNNPRISVRIKEVINWFNGLRYCRKKGK